MNDLNMLDQLRPIANETLGGLCADEALRLRIRRAAAEQTVPRKKQRMMRLAPALCCAALLCAAVAARLSAPMTVQAPAADSGVIAIDTIAAGDGAPVITGELVADLGDNARIRAAASQGESLFAAGTGDIPMVAIGGGVYRMLETPRDIGGALLGERMGSVQQRTDEPSLADGDALAAGLSNVADEGAAIYALAGLPGTTAVAVEVNGGMRVFQRVSYAGMGPGGLGLEDTFSVRGQVKEMTLSGVGTLSGERANEVIAVLLDQATLQSADASARRQTLTVTLDSGLKLQLGVSGDTLCGCGGWSCPEFFEAFEAAL